MLMSGLESSRMYFVTAVSTQLGYISPIRVRLPGAEIEPTIADGFFAIADPASSNLQRVMILCDLVFVAPADATASASLQGLYRPEEVKLLIEMKKARIAIRNFNGQVDIGITSSWRQGETLQWLKTAIEGEVVFRPIIPPMLDGFPGYQWYRMVDNGGANFVWNPDPDARVRMPEVPGVERVDKSWRMILEEVGSVTAAGGLPQGVDPALARMIANQKFMQDNGFDMTSPLAMMTLLSTLGK